MIAETSHLAGGALGLATALVFASLGLAQGIDLREPPHVFEEGGNYVWVIQGFESPAVFDKHDGVSFLSGVPEEAEVEFWTGPPAGRAKLDPKDCATKWAIAKDNVRQGAGALKVTFNSPKEWLRVSLRNNIDADAGNQTAATSLGFHDRVETYIFNEGKDDVEVEVRMLGGFAVTDKSIAPALTKTVKVRPGWFGISFSAEEASAALAGPLDPTCIEFRVPDAKGQVLTFDDFRMVAVKPAVTLNKHARCFDFGVKRFTAPGFLYGSVQYSPQLGYGFTAGEKLTHGGDLHIMDDELTRDGFFAPATFKLDLPAGQYRVWLQTGNYWARRDSGADVEIRANGRPVYRKPRLTREESIAQKHYGEEPLDIDRRDYDLWVNYEEGLNFREVRFEVVVRDKGLELEWRLLGSGGESTWTAMIVGDNETVERDIWALRERLRKRYNTVSHPQFGRSFALYNREEVIAAEEMLWPDIAAARRAALRSSPETGRGYLHFLRHRHEFITPDSVPLFNETGNVVTAFGAPGQTVFVQIGLYPLRDIGAVSLRMLTLDQVGGKAQISRDNMDVRLVSYRCNTPVTSSHAEPGHLFAPGVLMHSDSVMLHKDFPRAFHVAIDVPESLPPGRYEGQAQVIAGGEPVSAVAVKLTVLPIKLVAPKDKKLTVSLRWGATPPESFWERLFPGQFPGRYPELEAYKNWGMNGVWASGEPEEIAAVKKWGEQYGLDVITTDRKDTWWWVWPEQVNDAAAQGVKKSGKLLTYYCGSEEGRHQRFTWGFWLWRSPIDCRVLLIQPQTAERVYYGHAGHQKFGPAAYLWASREGYGKLNPSPTILEAADGIQDLAYIATLEEQIKAAPAEKKAEADEARAHLAELRKTISSDLSQYYFERERNFNHVGRWGVREQTWTGPRYDIERWELARRIAALSPAPAEQAAPAAPKGKRPELVAWVESFGPRFAGDDEYWKKSLGDLADNLPLAIAETPKVLESDPVAAIALYGLADAIAILRGADGGEIAREKINRQDAKDAKLLSAAFKTRVFINLRGLPVGDYTVEFQPAAGNGEKVQARVTIVPGF